MLCDFGYRTLSLKVKFTICVLANVPKLDKDILHCGTWTLGNGQQWTCTPGMVRAACANGNRMLRTAEAFAPPWVWEHHLDAQPVPMDVLLSTIESPREWRSGLAREMFGRVTGFGIKHSGGDPVLWATSEIPDTADARQLAKLKFVSSRVNVDYRDPSGRFHPGASIGHVAATAKPIQYQQQPVFLSAVPVLPRPGFARSFVFLSTNGGSTVADEKKPAEGDAAGGSAVNRCKAAMAMKGVTIPDSVTTPDDLALALEIWASVSEPDAGADDVIPDDDGMGGGTDAAVTPAMLSSLPVALANRLRATAKADKARMVGRVDAIRARWTKRGGCNAKKCDEMRAAASKLDESVFLSGMPATQPVVAWVETMESSFGVKSPSAGPRPPHKTIAVPIPDPSPEPAPGATDEQIEVARKRAVDRVKGIVPTLVPSALGDAGTK